MRLEGKTAIITGGGNGIGKETAMVFGAEGAHIIVADYNFDAAEAVAAEISERGGSALALKVNVADKDSVKHLVKQTVDHFGSLDILINNAGVTADALLYKLEEEDWQRVIDVNLKGVFLCAQAVVPYMVEQGYGKIISTSSVSGVYGNVGQTNYAATKAGVIGMTKSWAKEYGPKGLNINAVVPGFVATEMVAKVPEHVIDKMKKMIPLNRLGKPEDIAKAYLYLASDDANYVNGTALHVDGGIMM